MSTLKQVQGEIGRRMRRGDTFTTVEDEVIDTSELPDAEKAALWLYAWSFVHWRAQRREAAAHIDRLEGPAIQSASQRLVPLAQRAP